jgi:monothiol glutaredoxin
MTETETGVRQITVRELKALLDSGTPVGLWDVRTAAERRIAQIPGAQHLDAEGVELIDELDRDTLLVLLCHHGIRSQRAAVHLLTKGFTNVCNLVGGIDAWSTTVDASVPRY